MFMVLFILAVGPVATLAAKESSIDVSGTFSGEEVHFSAADVEYILKGKVHIENNSSKEAKNLWLVYDIPDNVSPAYAEDEPVELDTIPANGSIDMDIVFNMYGGDPGNDHALTAYIAVKNEDGELEKVAALDGEVDLSVLKGENTEIDATIKGKVIQDDQGNYILDMIVEGTNNSIYEIKPEDEIYLAFDLPYDVIMDMEKAPDGMFKTNGGGTGEVFTVPLDSNAEDTFTKEYSLPLKGEFHPNMMKNLNARIILLKRRPGEFREYVRAGAVNGSTNFDFTAMDEEKKKGESKDNAEAEKSKSEDAAVASSTVEANSDHKYTFFDTPFYVGAFSGIVITVILFLTMGRRKSKKPANEK